MKLFYCRVSTEQQNEERQIKLAKELGHKNIILHTQTTTWLAAKLYLDFGFEVLNNEEEIGWSILNTLINHDKLSNFKKIPLDEIYDKRNNCNGQGRP